MWIRSYSGSSSHQALLSWRASPKRCTAERRKKSPFFRESAYGDCKTVAGLPMSRRSISRRLAPSRGPAPQSEELMMSAGLHAVRWGLSRCAIALGLTVLAVVLAYVTLVFVLVAIQAYAGIGQ